MSEPEGPVTIRIGEHVATIELSCPGSRNAFTPEFVHALRFAAEVVSSRGDVRCVLIRAQGEDFSAGVDNSAESRSDEMVGNLRAAISILESLDVPVVVGVHGVVAGNGLALLSVADFVVAAHDSQFGFTLQPGGLLDFDPEWHLMHALGQRRALCLLLNHPVAVLEAGSWNLVDKVVPRSELNAALDELAESLARDAAHGRGRRKLRQNVNSGISEQLLLAHQVSNQD